MRAALAPLARFTSAAEAGYFAHELLHREQIPVSLTVDEHFDAIGGRWTTRFVLAVPEDIGETAREALQRLIHDSECDDDSGGGHNASECAAGPGGRYNAAVLEESGVHWVPIVLTLAVSSVAFWGAREFGGPPQRQARAAPAGRQNEQRDLWDELATPGRPWTQSLPGGQGRRELRFDRARGLAILREDADGDGRFETEIPFRSAE